MKKFTAVAIAVAMLSVLTPGVQAETVIAEYTLALGYRVDTGDPAGIGREGVGNAIIMCQGPPEEDICKENDIKAVGGYSLTPEAPDAGYTSLSATVTDTNFDATYSSICVYEGDWNICGVDPDRPEEEVDRSAAGCGEILVNDIRTIHRVSGFVYNAYVDANSLETCFGSSGAVSGVFT